MYDISKRFHTDDLSVAELIEQLKKLPQAAKVCICGDDCCHIHVERDGSVVNLDTEDLDDCYGEDASIEEGEFNYGGYRFVPYGFLSKRENDDFQYLSGKLRTDTDLGFFDSNDVPGRTQKRRYSYKRFYAAAPNHKHDIFKCKENGKLYIPGEHELFEYIPDNG